MSKRPRLREPFDKQHGKCASTNDIRITEPLSYLLIMDKWIEVENISLIDMPNLGTGC